MQTTRFAHHRLDAYQVAREALRIGHALAATFPRGHATLADQLRRALLGAFLQLVEAAARTGADRTNRFRCARGEANEAAGAIDAAVVVGVVRAEEVVELLVLLDRLCAMLTRLGGFGTRA